MSTSLPSDEVAEDYRNSLEDLITNDRYAISNLTLIAKENIEHAEAISRVLQNHIQKAPPARKLPALYVLDSIVKNVGTPYTVYFGRNLNQIFLLAYSQVDIGVRRKLEEMLKTWREPVPGSLSTVPVFPFQSTQAIVDGLNRFRSAGGSSQPRPSHPANGVRVSAMTQPYRATPTPPLPHQQQQPTAYPQPQHQVPPHQNGYPQPQMYQQPVPHPPNQYQAPVPQPAQHFHQQQPIPPRPTTASGAVDMVKLHADIDDLTIDAKIDCASHPMDQSAQKKLVSLQGLKEMLDSGTLSDNDLIAVRDSVMQQMAKKMAPHRPTPPIPATYNAMQHPQAYPVSQPVQQPPPQSSTPSFLNSTNLAELLRVSANRGQNQISSTQYPQTSAASYDLRIQPSNPAPPPIENPLLAQLRASGLLSGTFTPPAQPLTPTSTAAHLHTHTPSNSFEPPVLFSSASIRIPRPALLNSFLSALPNQCTTCGRRFTSDDIGREKKAAHLDWHFRTKTRMVEAERRGVNRSWYVDEREWIASREVDDDGMGVAVDIDTGKGAGEKEREVDWVRAPTDPSLRNAPCPIDQEVFRSEWSEEVQDFVWRDAVRVGGRYYHASCYREVMKGQEDKGGGGTPMGAGRTATPDSVLGKRKADRDTEEGKGVSRLKIEA